MERVLINGFGSIKRIRVFYFPVWDTNSSQVSTGAYLPTQEGRKAELA